MTKEMITFSECIANNINKGIAQGYYRKDVNVDNVVQFYFALVFYIYENMPMSSINAIEINALEYHTRAIATSKGIDELEQQLLIINSSN